MKKFKITYNTMFEVNKSVVIASENKVDALYLFNMNFHESMEVLNIVEVNE